MTSAVKRGSSGESLTGQEGEGVAHAGRDGGRGKTGLSQKPRWGEEEGRGLTEGQPGAEGKGEGAPA